MIQNVGIYKILPMFRTMPESDKMRALLELAESGPFRARDLEPLGIPRSYLSRLVERGVLERVSRGVYRQVDGEVTEFHSLAQVALRVPGGVVCLLSALQFHGLTTELPSAVWLMVHHKARAPTLDTPRLELVRATGQALGRGIEEHEIEGVTVKVTTQAKTVADCFRYRRHVGLDVAIEALREYVKRGRSIDALFEAANVDRVLSVMRPYVEAIA